MSNLANVWLAISSTATTAIRERLQWDPAQGDYNGPVTDTEHKIFDRMADFVTVERMFKRPTVVGKVWHLFSLNFRGSAKAKDALDFIAANRPGHFVIVGAWWWDGRQVGTEWELDQDGVPTGSITGMPMYPIHPQTIKFMPDIVEYDEDGNVISTTPATVVTDVNLIQGQKDRRFT